MNAFIGIPTKELKEANLLKFVDFGVLQNKSISSIKLQLSALKTIGIRMGYNYNQSRIKDYIKFSAQKARAGGDGKRALLKNDIKLLLNSLDDGKPKQYMRNFVLIKMLY